MRTIGVESKRVSELELERFLLGELPDRRQAELARRAEQEPELAERLMALRRSNAEILEAYPDEGSAIRARAAGCSLEVNRSKRPRFVLALAGGCAFALCTLVAVRAMHDAGPHPLAGDELALSTERLKGGVAQRLSLWRLEEGALVSLRDGATAQAGDQLQVTYRSQGERYGAVLSIDGRGGVTMHLPEREVGMAPRLADEGEAALPHSFELDDAPKFEWFLFLSAPGPFEVERALDAARRAARALREGKVRPEQLQKLMLDDDFSQTSLLIKKVEHK